jgi:hypothetical protein
MVWPKWYNFQWYRGIFGDGRPLLAPKCNSEMSLVVQFKNVTESADGSNA